MRTHLLAGRTISKCGLHAELVTTNIEDVDCLRCLDIRSVREIAPKPPPKRPAPRCRAVRCQRKAQRNGWCDVHASDFKGTGRLRCRDCGQPLRDHSLFEPCRPVAGLRG